jgi:hypothetical protein
VRGVGQRVGKAAGVDPGPKAELLRWLSVAGGAVELRDHGGAGGIAWRSKVGGARV